MSNKKKAIRQIFRDSVFARDRYRCVVCGKQATKENAEVLLDSHHICPREQMPNGGYCAANGVSLCKGEDGTSCHEKAELVLKGADIPGFTPEDLYNKIGSSHAAAVRASERLSS